VFDAEKLATGGEAAQFVLEPGFPGGGEVVNREGGAGAIRVFGGERICAIEVQDVGDGDGGGVMVQRQEFIACADLAFAHDGDIVAVAAALVKAADHLIGAEADAQFVAGHARLGDDDFGGADGEAVADVDVGLERTFEGEVLAEDAGRQRKAGELCLPVFVVRDGVAVDGFLGAAVHGEVRLAVAVEVEGAESDAAGDRLLKDRSGDLVIMPGNLAGQADVEGEEPHGDWIRIVA
jgi:hypothetical protein